MWIISLDARQGYHQIAVNMVDREKLAFFTPNHRKYIFNVILFGPTNTPPFYTPMMKDLKDEWYKLLMLHLIEMKTFKYGVIILLATGVVTIGGKQLIFSSETIIDDILLWCNMKELVLIYFRCIYKYSKYIEFLFA